MTFSAVSPFYCPARSVLDVFRRRPGGRGWRVIVWTLVASLLACLAACGVEVVWHFGDGPAASIAKVASAPAHHGSQEEGAPWRADNCAILQDVSVSTQKGNVMPLLLGVVVLFFPVGYFNPGLFIRSGSTHPPAVPSLLRRHLCSCGVHWPRAPPL